MKIIYDNGGVAAVLTPAPKKLASMEGTDENGDKYFPTEESKLIHIANKDLPTGTKYEIIDENVVDLSDRTFRNAWEYVAGAGEQTSADLSAEDLAKYNMTENL